MQRLVENNKSHNTPYPQKMMYNHSGILISLVLTLTISVSLVLSYLSWQEVSNLRFQITQMSSQSLRIEERQNFDTNVIVEQKKGLEKVEQELKTLIDQELTNLSQSLVSLQKDIEFFSYLRTEVNQVQKELLIAQFDIQKNGNHTNLISQNLNRIDQILTRVDTLENEQKSLAVKVNDNQNKIDQLKIKVDQIPLSSPNEDSLKLEVSEIKNQLSSLNLKINIDTFNKIEMFGPFYPNQHSVPIPVTNFGYNMFPTLQACILTIKSKAIVTLIATGHAFSYSAGAAQLSFMKNRQVELPATNSDKWSFGAQYVCTGTCPVNLTQEFMVEAGQYEFALGGLYPYGSTTIYLNGVSFVAKVTYIS